MLIVVPAQQLVPAAAAAGIGKAALFLMGVSGITGHNLRAASMAALNLPVATFPFMVHDGPDTRDKRAVVCLELAMHFEFFDDPSDVHCRLKIV